MRKLLLTVCVLLVLAAVTALAVVIGSMPATDANTYEPVGEEEEQALLDAVRTGCEAAASAIQSGVGVITVHDTMWRENGARRETEATYQLVQRGESVRVLFETRTIADEWEAPDLNAGGRIASSGSRWSLGSDGEVITYYEPDSKRATVGDRSSAFARLLESVLTITHAPGHAIPASVFDPDTWSEWASPPHVLGRETVNGEECVVVQVTRERVLDTGTYARTYKYWIDPSRGFSLVRFEKHLRVAPSEESVLMARFDIDTVPCGDGLWRISSWRQDQYTMSPSTGEPYLSARSTVTYSDDYQLNAPVTEEMLTIDLPSGTRVDYVFDSVNCRCHFANSSKQVKGGPVSVPPDFYLSKGFQFTWIRNFSGTYSKDGISCDTGASDPPGQPQVYWDEYWIMHFC